MTNTITPKQAAQKFSATAIAEGYIPEALHAYTDTENNILYWRIRLKNANGKKWIRPMYKDSNNQYYLAEPTTLINQAKPLYGLQLLAQKPRAAILIVEGEYPADVINQYFRNQNADYAPCVITSGSATSADNANWEPLAKRDCIIWPDNDEVGMQYAQQVYSKLEVLGCTVELVDPANLNLPEGGDCVDWLKANPSATIVDILSLPRLQKISNPVEPTQTDDDIITRLATLFPLEYDRIRIAEAKKLNVRPATLDNLVKAAKSISQKENKTPFSEIEPWDEPISPAELLTDISNTIRRFIICQPETAHAATLWIAMTWFIDVIHISPLAVITAPEKRCGKSQMLTLLSRIVNRPLAASNITSAALFRSVEAWKPTLLIDEVDTFMRENEELRGIINSGHTRESAYICRAVGDDHTPYRFSTWGAKALAGIGKLPGTIIDRSITLELRRKLPEEKTERLRHAEPMLFKRLSAKLARFAQDYSDKIRDAKPNLPENLNDRAQDNWESLLAIADIAGNEWPKLARTAAFKLSGDTDQSQSIGVQLLADIAEIYEPQRLDRFSSTELITALCKDDEKSWATYNRGHPISPRQIASRLREFGIVSNTIRFGLTTAKGYYYMQFADAFARYLSEPNVTTSQTAIHNSFDVT